VFWKTLWRLFKQSVIPLAVSLAYATWVYASKGVNAKTTDAVSAFGAAFFFCMWLLGQFFRTSKQLSDSANFNRLSVGIEDINKSIRELRSSATPQPAATPTSSVSPSAASAQIGQLMTQAKQLVQSGHVLAGLLQAGVAFEQAVYAKAQRAGLDRQEFRSLPQLLRRIEDHLGPGANQELQVLWKFRNQIVHADPQASEELQQRPELVNYFDSGIKMLGPDLDAF